MGVIQALYLPVQIVSAEHFYYMRAVVILVPAANASVTISLVCGALLSGPERTEFHFYWCLDLPPSFP